MNFYKNICDYSSQCWFFFYFYSYYSCSKIIELTTVILLKWARHCAALSRFSCVRLFTTSWTVAHQAYLSIGFSRQEYWSGLPCLPPGDLPNPGIEPTSLMSLASAGGFFTTSATCDACLYIYPLPNQHLLLSNFKTSRKRCWVLFIHLTHHLHNVPAQ